MESRKRVQVYLVRIGVALLVGAGCTRELPESGSPAAALYRERCGTCHRTYSPTSLTAPTWEMILPRMERYMLRSPGGPLSDEERRTILEYLRKHAA